MPAVPQLPNLMFASAPEEQTRLLFLEGGKKAPMALPEVGAVITLPFMVDPQSRQPVPIRVVRLVPRHEAGHDVVVVVVSRHDQQH